MKLSTAIRHLTSYYDKAKNNPSIRKPVSYALYKTWRWANTYEKERSKYEK